MGESPFVPGAVVALIDYPRWGGHATFKLGEVDKVYKTGKFTLKPPHSGYGDRPDQYVGRHSSFDKEWHAIRTGYQYGPTIKLWNDATKAEMQAAADANAHLDRCHEIATITERRNGGYKISPELSSDIAALIVAHALCSTNTGD